MKVFYINLKKRKDRKHHMEEMLSNLNLDYERFEAIRPSIKEIKFGKYKKFYERATSHIKEYVNKEKTHARAIGILGVYLSALKIHESQLGNLEPYIVLEDDVKITEKTISQIKGFISDEKYNDWDIIRSLWGSKCTKVKKFKGVHSKSKFTDQNKTHWISGGAHFTVFKNAKKIFDYMYSENVFAIDSLYSTCMLNVYHQKLDVSLLKLGTNIPKINPHTS
tara:strand:+ start:1248 stop:1913 length:666 start_codon:yes stop_codon:yes gene_type:complete